LAPKWMYSLRNANGLQVTPIVSEGVMYVTAANECYALDAGSGREIWHYQRARTKGLVGNAAGGVNRGASVAGDRLFMVTDHAHLIALSKHTGALLWETEMADWHQNYNATGAPLPVGNLVVTGTSGGDEGVRGFVAAFDQATGKEVWRWWTTPKRGEPGSETWQGKGLDHPAGTTWMNGKFLFGTQYVKNVTWATGLDANGRPLRVPNMEPTLDGKRVCPSLDGASNWYSTSFNPSTNLYYVQTNDKCGIFTKVPAAWEA